MDPDKRIVPENHIAYLLEEEHIPERTKAIKHRLIKSPKKIDKVAEHWVENSGVNSLARVMLTNVEKVPRTHINTQHGKVHHASHTPAAVDQKHHSHHHDEHNSSEKQVHADATDHHHDTHTTHDPHHATSHTKDTHSHKAHGHESHHEHEHHEHHSHHGHLHHGGHGHEHHGGHFSSFMSSGHWCGEQGARIFALIGRIVGEIIGYIIKTLMVAILFGPTRTAILVFCMSIFLNTTMDTSLPVGIAASIAGIIHLIFTGIGMIGGSGGHGGGGEHGGGGHGHH